MSGVLTLRAVLPFKLIRACFLWAGGAGLVGESQKNLVEFAESDAANTLKFMYESHNKHILHGGMEAKGG